MNSLSIALRAGYLSVRSAEGASEKQSSLKARLRNGLTYLLTYCFGKKSEMFICAKLEHCSIEPWDGLVPSGYIWLPEAGKAAQRQC